MTGRDEIRFRNCHRSELADRSRQGGFTLIEVLLGIVITSILVIGLSGLWTTVNNQFLFLTLKQKAIFVLNGEMERLAALYRFTGFIESGTASILVDYTTVANGDDYVDADDNTDESGSLYDTNKRRIFAADPASMTDLVVPSGAADAAAKFDCTITQSAVDDDAQFNSDCAGRVLRFVDGVGDGDDRNYVWIDQHRRIVGRMSWNIRDLNLITDGNVNNFEFPNVPDALPGGDNSPCWKDGVSDDECKELILYLQFPYRFASVTDPAGDTAIGRKETLVLKTIVGRR
jgi:prepilin-type N-terminal cleavage/methylation domain-containing protein